LARTGKDNFFLTARKTFHHRPGTKINLWFPKTAIKFNNEPI